VAGFSSSDYGVYGSSSTGIGVAGTTASGADTDAGVQGSSSTTDATGVKGIANNGTGAIGVYGQSYDGEGVRGYSDSGTGAYGISISGFGVHGYNVYSGNGGGGVWGESDDGNGVYGTSSGPPSTAGVYGYSTDGKGVHGESVNFVGVWGESTNGSAGFFVGDVDITGDLSVGGSCTGCLGPNKIDHPLYPANKYLSHATVQSQDMMNIYNGNVTTDARGEAVVQLPDWFEALNRDFRYQLTVMGQFAQAIVAQEIKDNRFTIQTDKPNVKVSWQVTGIRSDPYSNAHPISVEEDKPADERGKYIHPEVYGEPETKGIYYRQHPGDR
jgi:hypothetical protein